ncbi:GFA family protein [Sphingopyxis flava]|uniref:Uncharacterized conserved protein n=1 Tax=Sphingopyxis flava TaxID=1507287 RepID=A0A1T5ALT6_9SPHN|nr:GFA family protein [Sphingopyxis flava]SKB35789.1 Uncharacterized conserved protein [Sphingopyxis flava]
MKRIENDISGGCQCGAVRYHAIAVLDTSHICHCRMCQKAVGNYFAALVGIPRDALAWTRGKPATFKSSDPVERGFCRDCGTPLYYDFLGADYLSVTTGSLDEPARFPPRRQYGVEARLPWFDSLATLPGDSATEDAMPAEAAAIRASRHQHPDHDTENWPL